MRRLTTEWQVGDGREEALEAYVLEHARAGRDFMREHEGRTWRTVERETHVEYQSLIKDLVLESEYLGAT